MKNTIVFAKDITLHELEAKFNLSLNQNREFFPEWQSEALTISIEEGILLDLAKSAYLNLIKYSSMPENAVQLAVVSPLLHLSGLLLPPFHLKTEASIAVTAPNDELTIEGKIDILVIEQNFWVLVIESKRAEFSLKVGLAQILAYMLSNPVAEKPCFGLITNGGSYLFLKLSQEISPTYGISKVFDLLNPGNDLYDVLSILKNIKQLYLNSKNDR